MHLQYRDVPQIMFPIFTNGSYLGDKYLELFSRCRNLLPIMSIEGDESHTDERRGDGIYAKQMENMAALKERNILFGISVTVTKDNLEKVLAEEDKNRRKESRKYEQRRRSCRNDSQTLP